MIKQTKRHCLTIAITLIAAVLGLWLALYSSIAKADMVVDGIGTAALKWTPPTTYVDGTPLEPADIAGYVVFWGEQSRFQADGSTLRMDCSNRPLNSRTDATCYPNVVDLTDGQATGRELTFQINKETTLYFSVAVHDTSHDWSAYSNEISKPFVLSVDSPPGAPVLESITLQISCKANLPDVKCLFEVAQ